MWSVNPNLPYVREDDAGDLPQSLAATSFTLVMLAIAGTMALLLGIVGIYGVIFYAVSQRTREIAIRLALGANPGELKRMFVRHGFVLASLGVLAGLGAAMGLSRLMSSPLLRHQPAGSDYLPRGAGDFWRRRPCSPAICQHVTRRPWIQSTL